MGSKQCCEKRLNAMATTWNEKLREIVRDVLRNIQLLVRSILWMHPVSHRNACTLTSLPQLSTLKGGWVAQSPAQRLAGLWGRSFRRSRERTPRLRSECALYTRPLTLVLVFLGVALFLSMLLTVARGSSPVSFLQYESDCGARPAVYLKHMFLQFQEMVTFAFLAYVP